MPHGGGPSVIVAAFSPCLLGQTWAYHRLFLKRTKSLIFSNMPFSGGFVRELCELNGQSSLSGSLSYLLLFSPRLTGLATNGTRLIFLVAVQTGEIGWLIQEEGEQADSSLCLGSG